MILHITTREAWEQARKQGSYTAASLETEGFIHCSAVSQTTGTANLFFRGQKGLILLVIDETRLGAECRWEDPTGNHGTADTRNTELFPHVYGAVNPEAVLKTVDFPCDDEGSFRLPAELKETP